jgi:hypothetical protein
MTGRPSKRVRSLTGLDDAVFEPRTQQQSAQGRVGAREFDAMTRPPLMSVAAPP